MRVKKLNEDITNNDYLNSKEYTIQRYEMDIENLLTRLHAGFEDGKIYAQAYIEVLRDVYNALETLDYSDDALTEQCTPEYVNSNEDTMCDESCASAIDCDEDVFMYDDDYDDFSAFNTHDDIDRMNTLYTGGKNHRLSEGKTETEKSLEKALTAKRLKINPEYNSIEAAAEYIDMGGKDYSVDQWIKDTLQNYPKHLISEMKEDFKRNTNMNIKCDIALDRVAYDVSRILTDIDGERNDKEDQSLIFNCEDAKPVDGTNTEELELFFTVSGTDHSSKSQRYFEKQKKLKGKMTTNKGMINVSIEGGASKSFNNVRSIAAFIAVQFGILIRQ